MRITVVARTVLRRFRVVPRFTTGRCYARVQISVAIDQTEPGTVRPTFTPGGKSLAVFSNERWCPNFKSQIFNRFGPTGSKGGFRARAVCYADWGEETTSLNYHGQQPSRR